MNLDYTARWCERALLSCPGTLSARPLKVLRANNFSASSMAGIAGLPIPILSDSYKASHYKSYPEALEMKAVSHHSYFWSTLVKVLLLARIHVCKRV
jgi:hypothetical protein